MVIDKTYITIITFEIIEERRNEKFPNKQVTYHRYVPITSINFNTFNKD